MNSKHTPGPWHLSEEGRPVGADGQMVGEMSALMPFTMEEHARIIADRQLVTAAPELLEALRDIESNLTGSGDAWRWKDKLPKIRAAIIKATGETP